MKNKTLKIDCECAGGRKYCGYLRIYDFGDKDIDIAFFSTYEKKWMGGGYFEEKNIKKIIKFLQGVCVKKSSPSSKQ